MSWCPTCQTQFPMGERVCPKDGTALLAGERAAERKDAAPTAPAKKEAKDAENLANMGTVVAGQKAPSSAIPKTLVRVPQGQPPAEKPLKPRVPAGNEPGVDLDAQTALGERSRPEITLREMVMDLQAGHKVGEYVVERRLGEGGMAVVYAGIHPLIGKKVAIKLLAPALAADQDMVRRFVGEARAVNQIGHRNIVDIFAFGQLPDGRHYFVMELLEGESLAERLGRTDPPLKPDEVIDICLQIASAIGAAHQRGIVHRDLKPENLFLVASDRIYVKVLDFGIAKLLGPGPELSKTATGVPMGTPTYMSPEQTAGRGVDHRTDIYALGVILFQMITGRPPFESENYVEVLHAHLTQPPPPLSLYATVTPSLDSLVQRLLSKRPEDRPPSMDEIRQKLKALQEQDERGTEPLFVRKAQAKVAVRPRIHRTLARAKEVASPWRITVAAAGLAVVAILIAIAIPRRAPNGSGGAATGERAASRSAASAATAVKTPAPPPAVVPPVVLEPPKAPSAPIHAALVIDVEPPEVRNEVVLYLNDAPKRPDELAALAPGTYRVVARAPGYTPASSEVTLAAAEKRNLQLVLHKVRRRDPAVTNTVPTPLKAKPKVDTPAGPIDRNATLKPDFGP